MQNVDSCYATHWPKSPYPYQNRSGIVLPKSHPSLKQHILPWLSCCFTFKGMVTRFEEFIFELCFVIRCQQDNYGLGVIKSSVNNFPDVWVRLLRKGNGLAPLNNFYFQRAQELSQLVASLCVAPMNYKYGISTLVRLI